MLSSSLSQLFERARTRFGLEVEVLDATLQQVYPESTTALMRLIEESPMVRQSLLNALADGRPEQVDGAGLQYQVFPLRRAARVRKASALVAVRRSERASSPADERAWPELARAMVEADFAASDALSDERQQSRRSVATLRFLRHLIQTDTEAELARAVVQASAVWFDVDARVFQRDLSGAFVLHTALPGAQVEEPAKRLSPNAMAGDGDTIRVAAIPEWGAAGNSEVVLVPLSASETPELVLALIGTLPADADLLFGLLGRIIGFQLDAIRSRQRDRIRDRFESLIKQGAGGPELLAVGLIRELATLTGAGYASLVLNRRGSKRHLVRFGTTAAVPPSADESAGDRFSSSQFICRLPLSASSFAVFELRPAEGKAFDRDAELVTRAAAAVLQSWLTGAEASLDEVVPQPQAATAMVPEFIRRIEEELERAKRFDLRLSLVLVHIQPHGNGTHNATWIMQDALRQELRGSDVLGRMTDDRLAALLTHTDSSGSDKVVSRLRRRLGEAAIRLNLSEVRVGHAVFSADCRTAEALLSQALHTAQPVAMPS